MVAAAVAGANSQDNAVQKVQDEPAYDSARRRQQLAESLEGKCDSEAINSRLLAEKHQARPAADAAAHRPSLVKISKLTKQSGTGKGLERGGFER